MNAHFSWTTGPQWTMRDAFSYDTAVYRDGVLWGFLDWNAADGWSVVRRLITVAKELDNRTAAFEWVVENSDSVQ